MLVKLHHQPVTVSARWNLVVRQAARHSSRPISKWPIIGERRQVLLFVPPIPEVYLSDRYLRLTTTSTNFTWYG